MTALDTASDCLPVLVIGRHTRPEFAELVAALEREGGASSIRTAESIHQTLIDEPAQNSPGDVALVVVLQTHPDEYAAADAMNLLDRYPLSRLIVCAGAWCDSDGRTRDVWPLATCVPVPLAVMRLRSERAVVRGERRPLPLTGSRADAYCFDVVPIDKDPPAKGCLCVQTPDPAIRRWLCDSLVSAGYVVTADATAADAVLWDLDPWSTALAEDIRRFHLQRPAVHVVGLAGFAREEQMASAGACGVAMVIPKTIPLVAGLRRLGRSIGADETPMRSFRITGHDKLIA